jgi:hypothetical protein
MLLAIRPVGFAGLSLLSTVLDLLTFFFVLRALHAVDFIDDDPKFTHSGLDVGRATGIVTLWQVTAAAQSPACSCRAQLTAAGHDVNLAVNHELTAADTNGMVSRLRGTARREP